MNNNKFIIIKEFCNYKDKKYEEKKINLNNNYVSINELVRQIGYILKNNIIDKNIDNIIELINNFINCNILYKIKNNHISYEKNEIFDILKNIYDKFYKNIENYDAYYLLLKYNNNILCFKNEDYRINIEKNNNNINIDKFNNNINPYIILPKIFINKQKNFPFDLYVKIKELNLEIKEPNEQYYIELVKCNFNIY